MRRVDTSPTNTTPMATSQATRELLSTNSSGNSTVATYPAVRDTAGTAEEDFVPSAAWRSRQATNLISWGRVSAVQPGRHRTPPSICLHDFLKPGIMQKVLLYFPPWLSCQLVGKLPWQLGRIMRRCDICFFYFSTVCWKLELKGTRQLLPCLWNFTEGDSEALNRQK